MISRNIRFLIASFLGLKVSFIFIMSNFPWLTIIIFLPISAGSLIPFFPNKRNSIIHWYTLGICLVEFLLITYIFSYHFNPNNRIIQLREDYNWINFLDLHWKLRIDGLSIGLILFVGFITTLATLATWPITQNPRLFHFVMLAMYNGQIGLFASQDFLLFIFYVGTRIDPSLFTLIYVGRKKMSLCCYKIYFIYCRSFYFHFNRSLNHGTLWI